MDKAFLSVLNMSLTGAFVIAALLLARIPLKKAPKFISYALWAIAGVRLVFPFSLSGLFSFIPFHAKPIPSDVALVQTPHIDSGIRVIDNAVSGILPAAAPAASINPMQIIVMIGSSIWLTGIATMLIYSLVSILLLRHRLRSAIRVQGNVYEAENLRTPFVIGLFRPRIYIPTGLADEECHYILLHERTHIRRKDHLIKMLAYLVLCLHWFNPLAWAAFLLMSADMEMSCDERVLKELGGDIREEYSLSLVRVAAGRRILNGSPLAFGEGGLKTRVKNILNFRKPSRIIIVAAVALAAVLTVGFLANKANTSLGQQGIKYFTADVIQVHDASLLIQPDGKEIERRSSDLFEIALKPEWKMDINLFHVGESVTVYYSGGILESYPARLGKIEKLIKNTPDNSISPPGWMGNIDGKVMTPEQAKPVAQQYLASSPALTVQDLYVYQGGNVSNNTQTFNMIYAVGTEYTLQALAGEDGKITKLSIRRIKNNETMEITPQTVSQLDAFFQDAQPILQKPLAQLPAKYTVSQAVSDGVFVKELRGAHNQDAVDRFYQSILTKTPAFLRTMFFTVEGDPILTDYQYNGKTFTVTTDDTRDKFGERKITTTTYHYLVRFNGSHPANVPEQYFLSNTKNIWESTDDGQGAKTIDGLGHPPSPSEGIDMPDVVG